MAIGHSSLPRKIFCNILTAFYTLKLYISTLLVSCGLYWKTSAGGIHPVLRQIWDDIQSHLKKFSIFMCSLYDYLMNCLDICFMNYQDKSSNELTKSISSSRLKIIAQSSIIVGKKLPQETLSYIWYYVICWFSKGPPWKTNPKLQNCRRPAEMLMTRRRDGFWGFVRGSANGGRGQGI